jgi:2-polyprenyl-3-methyl-5-hydroxy-6-metoxy-1,4-benzoquinol methylase
MNENITCWCGSTALLPFSDGYLFCENCKTLVLKEQADKEDNNLFSVENDDKDFYGKQYWFEHQEADLGFGNIFSRTRTDLPERILYWLGTLLKYKTPPGRTLELGSSHGGFVAMQQWAGFDATGTEMSPWVVDFARETFKIPMLVGEIEKQDLPPASFDAISLMDVLEHLPDPAATMSYCLKLLKPDGVLLIQTPCYKEGRTHKQMLDEQDAFLGLLKAPEHVYLFSQSSVTEMFRRIGAEYVIFELPFFSQYDMFFAVSRKPLQANTREQVEQALMNTPGGRLLLALLDKQGEVEKLTLNWQESEADREARLQVILRQGQWYSDLQQQYSDLQQQYSDLNTSFSLARDLLRNISQTRLYRFMRWVGLWEWVESSMKTIAKF